MLIFLQLLTMAVIVAGTFLVFHSLGPQRGNLLYTKAEKKRWDDQIGARMRIWFTRTNIVGTLTSLATVYLFFIGNSKLFGWWIFLCCFSMFLGSFVTNYVTGKVWSSPHIQSLLKEEDITGGVIASVFWRRNPAAKQTALTIKWLSMLSLAAFIWLDFALFADISGRLLSVDVLWFRLLLLATACFGVSYFTLRFGLRGFVFADLFHSPLIVLASCLLLIGCVILGIKFSIWTMPLDTFFKPVLSQKECIIFAIHVLFLNSFLVISTESHWFRLWLFGDAETTQQRRSQVGIALLWGFLIIIGFFASNLSGGKVGEDAVVALLRNLSGLSWIFPVAFWIGGTAALFSSADASIYSFLIVRRFDNASGKLLQMRMAEVKPVKYTLFITVVFGVAYALVRQFQIPFEKIIFVVIPLTLNVLPAFVFAVRKRPQNPFFIWLSLALYGLASVCGFIQPSSQLFWTLMAALMPIGVSLIACLFTLGKPLATA
jgi:hypothetical protein